MDVAENLDKNQDLCMLHLYHVLQYLEQFKLENGESDIYHVLENWVRFHYSREMRCGMCNEKGVAVGYCRDCEKPWFIDQLCFKFHQKISTLEGHRLIDFKSDGRNFRIRDFAPQQFCENHKDLELQLYCNNCKIAFCQKCEGKKHEYEHNVHSTNHIYMLLDNIHDTKRQIQGLQTNQNLDQHKCDKLTTMITWINVALGIDNRYSGIKDVPVPLVIFRLFEHESSAHIVFIKCEAVIKKLTNIQGDLCVAFTNQSMHAQREEDDTIPKVVISDGDQSTIYQRCSHAEITKSNSQIGGLTDVAAPGFCNRIRQVVEDEVTGPQQEMDPNVNVNNYRDSYTRGSHNVQNVFRDGGGLPNRPSETGGDPLVDQARWLSKNASIIQTKSTYLDESSSTRSLQHTENPRSSSRDTLLEMGFSMNDIEKAYAVLEKSRQENICITVDMLLSKILETKENPRDVDSSFASQQRRREEKECTKKEVEIICQICSVNKVTIAFLPCGHRAACVKCAAALEKCPVCRTVIRIY